MRDEIRKLIGGYATGSLSEAEKKTLFEAALDDQELFDQLAGEQALKELLDQPGAKQRLITALEGPQPGGFAWRRWIWTTAVAMIALAIGLTTWVRLRAPKPVQVAAVQVPLAPVNPPLPVSEPAAAVPRAEPVKKTKAPPVIADRKDDRKEDRAETAAPALKKDAAEPVPAESKAELAPPQQQQQPQAAPPAPEQVQVQAQTAQTAQSGLREADTASRSAGSGGRGALFAPSLAKVANLFSFDYRLEPGYLTVKTTAAGTLHVSGTKCLTCDDFTELQATHVGKDATTRIPVAEQYVVLAITFSARSDAEKQPPTAQVTRTERAGTVADSNPSPNSKIALRLELR